MPGPGGSFLQVLALETGRNRVSQIRAVRLGQIDQLRRGHLFRRDGRSDKTKQEQSMLPHGANTIPCPVWVGHSCPTLLTLLSAVGPEPSKSKAKASTGVSDPHWTAQEVNLI